MVTSGKTREQKLSKKQFKRIMNPAVTTYRMRINPLFHNEYWSNEYRDWPDVTVLQITVLWPSREGREQQSIMISVLEIYSHGPSVVWFANSNSGYFRALRNYVDHDFAVEIIS
jgi:hypothetical protein